jgi:DNA-binding response OmpR family regulator
MRILIVEDDKKVASFIRKGLQEERYAVDVAHDGESALFHFETNEYDVVILDLMLPRLDGMEVLRRMRASGNRCPVLVLTAKGGVENKVEALDCGADDYLVKPFAFVELSARVRALLRRGMVEKTALCVANLMLDATSRTVSRDGHRIELTPKEYSLLEFLMRHANRPVSRTMIIEHVWDIHFDGISNVVDVHINWLRQKIDQGFTPQLIRTIRGVGYMLTDEGA